MKYVIAALMTLSIVGCGKEHTVDPTFGKYTDMFEKDIGVSASDIYIHFEDSLPNKNRAECVDHNEIKVERAAWNAGNENYKIALMYHELGHCVLHKAHVESGEFNDKLKCASSIMYPWLPDPDCIPLHMADYIAELKS